MKLSDTTVSVLKNFSQINSNIQFRKGKSLVTMSPAKNILAKAELTDEIPKDFAIYDLSQYLAILGLDDDADVSFEEKYLLLVSGNNKRTKYYYADPSLVESSVPKKEIKITEFEIEFELSQADLNSLTSAASVLGVEDLVLKSDGKEILLVVTDKKNDTSNERVLTVGEGNGATYEMSFKVENLKLLKGAYKVKVSKSGISSFINETAKVQYWIALEPDFEYNAAS